MSFRFVQRSLYPSKNIVQNLRQIPERDFTLFWGMTWVGICFKALLLIVTFYIYYRYSTITNNMILGLTILCLNFLFYKWKL